jgi:hypothetical protein
MLLTRKSRHHLRLTFSNDTAVTPLALFGLTFVRNSFKKHTIANTAEALRLSCSVQKPLESLRAFTIETDC